MLAAHDAQSDEPHLHVGVLLVRVRAAQNTATKASGMAPLTEWRNLCAALRREAPTEVGPISRAICGTDRSPRAEPLGPARISRPSFPARPGYGMPSATAAPAEP